MVVQTVAHTHKKIVDGLVYVSMFNMHIQKTKRETLWNIQSADAHSTI